MGRAPCCDKANVKKGPWSPEEDAKLKDFIDRHGTGGNWIALPQKAGLKRCGKSCRLRWLNYLRPNIKHGEFSDYEDRIICTLFANIGSRWSIIAAQLPGRTDNDIKNYWNTKLKKKLFGSYRINPSNNLSSIPEQHHDSSPFSRTVPMLSSVPSTYISDFYRLGAFGSSSSSSVATLQPQDETLLGPYNVYGHEPASCSSSDGSSNGDYHRQFDHQQMANSNLQGFSSSTYYKGEILGGDREIVNHASNAPLDYYGIEEIKQLISSSSSPSPNIPGHNNNSCNYRSFLFDIENNSSTSNVAGLATRADEGFLYYYW